MQVLLTLQAHVHSCSLHRTKLADTFKQVTTLGRHSHCSACMLFTKAGGPTRDMARTCVMLSLGNVCVDVCVHLGVWLTEVETCAAEGSSPIRIGASPP